MTQFSNSYIITNRSNPAATSHTSITPLSGGQMWFYEAAGAYNSEVTDYAPVGGASTTPPATFLNDLVADAQLAASSGFPQLTVLIHGLGNTFASAINELSIVGSGIQQYANYTGLIISFDWPSYTMIDSALYYSTTPYSFPPTQTSGTIRGNINGSIAAFQNLMTMLTGIQSKIAGLQLNIICHSEGNYMTMLGLNAMNGSKSFLSQTLMVAADINNGALQATGGIDVGQGLPIASLASRVSVYYSTNDDVLPLSQSDLAAYHNPSFPDRLGLEGPASFAVNALPPNTYGIDCSAVISDSVIKQIPQVPPGTTSHSSYFYIPQVLQDWAQTLTGTAAGSVVNRTLNTNAADGQGYTMTFVQPVKLTLRRAAGA